MLASGNPPVHLFRYADFRYIPKTYGDQPVNLNASMMCGAKLNEKICECTNAQDEFKRDA